MTAVMRQTRIGLSLAALIVGAWLMVHIWGVFFQPVTGLALGFAPLLILTPADYSGRAVRAC